MKDRHHKGIKTFTHGHTGVLRVFERETMSRLWNANSLSVALESLWLTLIQLKLLVLFGLLSLQNISILCTSVIALVANVPSMIQIWT